MMLHHGGYDQGFFCPDILGILSFPFLLVFEVDFAFGVLVEVRLGLEVDSANCAFIGAPSVDLTEFICSGLFVGFSSGHCLTNLLDSEGVD